MELFITMLVESITYIIDEQKIIIDAIVKVNTKNHTSQILE